MAEATDKYGILKQNLEDAGCDSSAAEACFQLAQQNRWDEIALLLRQQKSTLLDVRHTNQHQIDCLDYLIYKIGKEHEVSK